MNLSIGRGRPTDPISPHAPRGQKPQAAPKAMRARTGLSALTAGLLIVAFVCIAAPGLAQHGPGDSANAPPPPAGDGVLTVQLMHGSKASASAPSAAISGLDIALYALSPDGNPGFTNTETDESGKAVFAGISTNPAIVYLVGARYAEIPFGERVMFAAGQNTARVEVKVSSPTDDVTGVKVEELRARLDWTGAGVVVREIQRIRNDGDRVVLLPKDDRSAAITLRPLPPGATDFSPGPNSIGDGLGVENDSVRFYGPLYPGEQRVEYQYRLPIEGLTGTLPITLREAANRVVIVAGTPGLEATGKGLVASSEVQSDSGQALSAWALAKLSAGRQVNISFTLPETRRDAGLVTLPRSDIWLELDDTRLTATTDLQLFVGPGVPVSGTAEAPLFHVSLPKGATLNGVAPEAEALGLLPTQDGGFDIIGPIAAGETSLGFSYQMLAGRKGVDLGLQFPREVGTLNILIADTGLALESSRLHRRRPFRNGTRNYLHREAYHVSPDEIVDLKLSPIQGAGLPRSVTISATIAAAAAAVFFLIMPLRTASRREEEAEAEWAPIRAEREGVYATIRDLDHDFETGKIEADDYQPMRNGLRDRAIELLRMEREGQTSSAALTAAAPTAAAPTAATPSSTTAAPAAAASAHVASTSGATAIADGPPTGGFCPDCGGQVDAKWLFCSHCGGQLNPIPQSGG